MRVLVAYLSGLVLGGLGWTIIHVVACMWNNDYYVFTSEASIPWLVYWFALGGSLVGIAAALLVYWLTRPRTVPTASQQDVDSGDARSAENRQRLRRRRVVAGCTVVLATPVLALAFFLNPGWRIARVVRPFEDASAELLTQYLRPDLPVNEETDLLAAYKLVRCSTRDAVWEELEGSKGFGPGPHLVDDLYGPDRVQSERSEILDRLMGLMPGPELDRFVPLWHRIDEYIGEYRDNHRRSTTEACKLAGVDENLVYREPSAEQLADRAYRQSIRWADVFKIEFDWPHYERGIRDVTVVERGILNERVERQVWQFGVADRVKLDANDASLGHMKLVLSERITPATWGKLNEAMTRYKLWPAVSPNVQSGATSVASRPVPPIVPSGPPSAASRPIPSKGWKPAERRDLLGTWECEVKPGAVTVDLTFSADGSLAKVRKGGEAVLMRAWIYSGTKWELNEHKLRVFWTLGAEPKVDEWSCFVQEDGSAFKLATRQADGSEDVTVLWRVRE